MTAFQLEQNHWTEEIVRTFTITNAPVIKQTYTLSKQYRPTSMTVQYLRTDELVWHISKVTLTGPTIKANGEVGKDTGKDIWTAVNGRFYLDELPSEEYRGLVQAHLPKES